MKVSLLKAYSAIHNFDIMFLSKKCLNSETHLNGKNSTYRAMISLELIIHPALSIG